METYESTRRNLGTIYYFARRISRCARAMSTSLLEGRFPPLPCELGKRMEEPEIVLVTGATGFIASHLIKVLLDEGKYKVRGTVRDLSDEKVRLRRLQV